MSTNSFAQRSELSSASTPPPVATPASASTSPLRRRSSRPSDPAIHLPPAGDHLGRGIHLSAQASALFPDGEWFAISPLLGG